MTTGSSVKGEKGDSYFVSMTFSMKWVIKISLIIMSIIMLAWWCETFYWRYWPFEPLVIYGEIKILNPQKIVYPGGLVLIQIDYEKKIDIPVVITTQYRNTFTYDMVPVVPPYKPVGIRTKLATPLLFPRIAEYGKYDLIRTYTYEIGPEKRKISVTAISEPFFCVPDPSKVIVKQGKQGVLRRDGAPGK